MSLIALIGLLSLVALVSKVAVRKLAGVLVAHKIIDTPNERTVHHGSIPRGGGLIIIISIVLVGVLATFASAQPQTFLSLTLLVVLCAALGWRDDTHQLSPALRFLAQIILAIFVLLLFGFVSVVRINHELCLPLGSTGFVLTLLGIVWFTNLYNFMDGMDGLAASQTIVGAVTLAFWSWQFNETWLALTLMVLAASTYGFLLINWHPARVFMGDVGSITLGLFFATVVLILHVRHALPILALGSVFAVFVVDATLTLFRRLAKGEKIWLPHRSHYYQRLAALGYRHSKIVVVYIGLMILCAAAATLALGDHDRIPILLACVLGVLSCAALMVSYLERRHRND